MKKILLPHNKFALVDDEDFDELNKYRWNYHSRYVVRHQRRHEYDKPENRKRVSMHGVLLQPPEGSFVDHINHNPLDNRKCNLRIANSQQNSWNRKKSSKKGYSKYKGVSFFKKSKKWVASIKCNYKNIYLGSFDVEEEAAEAYKIKSKELFGEFAFA